MKLRNVLSLAVMFTGVTFAQESISTTRVEIAPPGSAPSKAAAEASPSPSFATSAPAKPKLGPLEISVNWRTRAEGWNWFEGQAGDSDYGFWNSTLRIGLGQTRERVDWFVEGEQGKGVVASIYPKQANGQFIFLETNVHF